MKKLKKYLENKRAALRLVECWSFSQSDKKEAQIDLITEILNHIETEKL